MHGPRISRRSDCSFFVLTGILLLGPTALWRCSGAKGVEPKAERAAPDTGFLHRFEKSFNPAEYDADISVVKQEEKTERSVVEAAHVITTALPETIPGFRVQVLLTQDIDEAVQARDSLENRFPDEWTYIVFDSPYYKVRVGNYEDRASASHILKRLGALGFNQAWIVPDNVLKNLPPKPPELNIEPEKQIEHHRQ
jgi:sporulation related protein